MARVSTGDTVRVKGLDEFRKALRDMDKDWPKVLGQANKAAASVVAEDAQRRGRGRGGVHAHVARSIQAAAQQRQAVVSTGGPRWPMAWGAEFGSKRYRQFPPWRGNQWQPDVDNGVGYMIHPAVRDTREEVMDVYEAALAVIASHAFPQGG